MAFPSIFDLEKRNTTEPAEVTAVFSALDSSEISLFGFRRSYIHELIKRKDVKEIAALFRVLYKLKPYNPVKVRNYFLSKDAYSPKAGFYYENLGTTLIQVLWGKSLAEFDKSINPADWGAVLDIIKDHLSFLKGLVDAGDHDDIVFVQQYLGLPYQSSQNLDMPLGHQLLQVASLNEACIDVFKSLVGKGYKNFVFSHLLTLTNRYCFVNSFMVEIGKLIKSYLEFLLLFNETEKVSLLKSSVNGLFWESVYMDFLTGRERAASFLKPYLLGNHWSFSLEECTALARVEDFKEVLLDNIKKEIVSKRAFQLFTALKKEESCLYVIYHTARGDVAPDPFVEGSALNQIKNELGLLVGKVALRQLLALSAEEAKKVKVDHFTFVTGAIPLVQFSLESIILRKDLGAVRAHAVRMQALPRSDRSPLVNGFLSLFASPPKLVSAPVLVPAPTPTLPVSASIAASAASSASVAPAPAPTPTVVGVGLAP